MSSRFSPKHQKKVAECYPKGTCEVGAAAGKISALTYYINAKPAKLLKVTAYLERKVPRDLTRESSEYNGVTLEIVEGIMSNCSEYFASFAPTVLRLIIMFSTASLTKELNIRLNNLAVVSMEDFRGPMGDERIRIIINSLIYFFGTQDSTQLDIGDLFQKKYTLFLINKVSKILSNNGKTEPMQIIGHSFVVLVEGSNSTTVPIILTCLFREFDADNWVHQRLSGGILNIFIHSVPAQYLCVILSEIFRKLEETEDNATSVLADTIAELLRSNRSPLGYSGLELSRNLLKLLRKQKPDATTETRASIIVSKVRPPRTIYSICNAFVALLRNANFALQKYEIIEAIIAKAFFKDIKLEVTPSERSESLHISIPLTLIDRHSMGTVTLDQSEEVHFRSVVWGILFALAEEGSSPSVLHLAFVEIHVKLFDMLFRMISIGDEGFVLNTLVFWRQLLIHGLPIAPTRRTTTDTPSSLAKSVVVLGRPSLYILANSRLVLSYIATTREFDLTILHITAILSLVQSLIGECDGQQLARFLTFLLWLYSKFMALDNLTSEEKSCIVLFTLYVVRDIGSTLVGLQGTKDHNGLIKIANQAISRLEIAGMTIIEMEDILNSTRSVFNLLKGHEVNPNTLMPSEEQIIISFGSSYSEKIDIAPYSQDFDQEIIAGQQKGHEKSLFHRNTTGPPAGSPRMAHHTINSFSRLSKMSTTASVVTAPAFYQVESGSQPTRTLTVSSSSLAHSESQSGNIGSLAVDPLEEPFDRLSIKMREKRQKDKTKSLLFFKKTSK